MIGRLAPAPTAPGKGGAARLNPVFVEWMMGLELGHVTSKAIGLTRNEQLKALGNGVVPQQAALAIRSLLGVGAPIGVQCAVQAPAAEFPTPTAGAQGKSRRVMTASRDNGRRSGGGQSSPLGLEETASLLAGVRPGHLPADEDLPPSTLRVVRDLLPGDAS